MTEKERDNELQFDKINEGEEEMTYFDSPLPNTMLYYILYFKSLEDDDTKKYIESIIDEEFPKGENEKNENSILREKAIEIIYDSHKYVRQTNGISSVSLRDFQRFRRAYQFFNKYYKYKKEYLKSKQGAQDNLEEISNKAEIKLKIQSLVLSLFITYFIRISKFGYHGQYFQKINLFLINLEKELMINDWIEEDKKQYFNRFKTIFMKEEDFLLKEMEVDQIKGIGLNGSLKRNIFLMFFSIYSQIPLIVVGNPGCSKSLSIQLIFRIIRGEFSNSDFLKKFPAINITVFQGSENDTPELIESIFNVAEKKAVSNDKENKEISLLVFDELGLSGRSPKNCLQVLHSKLEMSVNQDGKNCISFIGISNWKLDSSKMNRAIFLTIPETKLDDIYYIMEAIANSYNEKIFKKYETYYDLLATIFYKYKEGLKNLKNEFYKNFHDERDLYHLVRIFSSEIIKYNMPEDPNIINLSF